MNSTQYVDVFTDGVCPEDGLRGGKKAGVGVFFGDKNKLNVSAPVVGTADSIIAEIQAVTTAAEVALSAGIKKLRINTDSQIVMESAAELTSNGKLDGSTAVAGKPAAVKDALQKMAAAVAPLNVQWNHVRGHDGYDMAYKLARRGANGYTSLVSCPSLCTADADMDDADTEDADTEDANMEKKN